MYSDRDLAGAVNAGAMSEDAVAGLRSYMEAQTGLSLADREHQSYFSGYHEILAFTGGAVVAIALGVLLGSIGIAFGAFATVAALWAFSEIFVRRLGSTYVGIWFCVLMWLAGTLGFLGLFNGEAFIKNPQAQVLQGNVDPSTLFQSLGGIQFLMAGLFGGYFMRFKLAFSAYMIAIAVTLGTLIVTASGLVQDPSGIKNIFYVMLFLGIVFFAIALALDFRDPERTGLASEVAVWLHIIAAATLANGLFSVLGVGLGNAALLGRGGGTGIALIVLLVYLLLSLVAVIINRRAFIVGAISFPWVALAGLFASADAQNVLPLAWSGILLGAFLVVLAIWWVPLRAAIISKLPVNLQNKLPRYAGQAQVEDEAE
jgi:hypothetical protein